MFAVAFIACVLPLVGVTLGQSLKPYTQPWKLSDYKHPPLAIADDRDRSCIFREDNTGPWPFLSVHFTVYDRDWSPYDQAGVKGGCGRGLLDNLRGCKFPPEVSKIFLQALVHSRPLLPVLLLSLTNLAVQTQKPAIRIGLAMNGIGSACHSTMRPPASTECTPNSGLFQIWTRLAPCSMSRKVFCLARMASDSSRAGTSPLRVARLRILSASPKRRVPESSRSFPRLLDGAALHGCQRVAFTFPICCLLLVVVERVLVLTKRTLAQSYV